MPRRFHTPGHAGFNLLRNAALPGSLSGFLPDEVYRFDLSEVGDLDVLSEPTGILKDAQDRAAKIYGVRDSFFLVNGASIGITAAMLAILKPGDKVLVPRNVHRSVISGLILTGAIPIWILPDSLPEWGLWGAVNPEQVENYFQQNHSAQDCHSRAGGNPLPGETTNSPIKALILTSPTYEGIGSDIKKISKICRQHNALLIIDEAHGALWPFSDQLPTSAIQFDCDCVVQSLHKTGGSLTQTALAHLPKTSRIPREDFQQALNTLQTTSPSYLLLASLDATISWLASDNGQSRINALLQNTHRLRQNLQQSLQHLQLLDLMSSRAQRGISLGPEEIPHSVRNDIEKTIFDPTKLYFKNPTTPDNTQWANRLEYDHGLPYEAASPTGILYLANIGLQPNDFDYFLQTLHSEDQHQTTALPSPDVIPAQAGIQTFHLPQMAMPPREAFFAAGETLPREQSLGRTAKQTLVHCPPGIPILLPGEIILKSHLSMLPATIHVVS